MGGGGVVLLLLLGGHGGFEGEFVGCEEGAEAGEGGEVGGEEQEEVDCLGGWGGDWDRGVGVGDAMSEGFVVGED